MYIPRITYKTHHMTASEHATTGPLSSAAVLSLLVKKRPKDGLARIRKRAPE